MRLMIIFTVSCVAVVAEYPRPVTKILTVPNGGIQGKWFPAQFCPRRAYATEFSLKVQPDSGITVDDTALNAIKLGCTFDYEWGHAGDITSHESPWGDWTDKRKCRWIGGTRMFITGYRLRVEKYQGVLGDDTAANNIIFRCTPKYGYTNNEVEGKGEKWGTYGPFSGRCPFGSAICGLQVKAEKPQGAFGDDTAINDVKFFCCNA